MPSGASIISSHTDDALNAEIAFWAASAGVSFVTTARAQLAGSCADATPTAILFELKQQDEEGIDALTHLCTAARCKVIAITTLDQKTISSIRRLFDSKSLDVAVMARSEFSTRLLSDLLKLRKSGAALDRETLAEAIRDGLVIAHYQPKVPFQPGSDRYGVEALCRIEHPTLGMLYPDSFIPLAEAHGLIHDLTDAVTVHAFRSQAEWDRQGVQLRLAINISPNLMADSRWYDQFQLRCQEYAVDPARIILEVTESSSHGGKAQALEVLSRLRLKGFLLSIDDFGTGFSSLETLYKLPFGELKIDKGFVFDLQKSPEARALVESTISLAKKLGLKITAEGVENEELFNELRKLQCDDAQGYFISKPLPAERILPFLSDWRARTQAAAPSKFAAIHALLAELLSPAEDEDCTVVLSEAAMGSGPMAIALELPALLMAGKMVQALACIHQSLAACANGDTQMLPKLQQLQREVENELRNEGRAELLTPNGEVKLLGGTSFLIGRQAAAGGTDIAIPCRWLSRGDKSLRLFRHDDAWHVEDLGSTNGHFLHGVKMAVRHPVKLAQGILRIEVGRSPDGHAPAWLDLDIRESAVALAFGMTGGQAETENVVWIAMSGAAAIQCDTTISLADQPADAGADIQFRDGELWVAPREGQTIALDDIAFQQAVPLPLGSTLTLGSVTLPIQALRTPSIAPAALAASA